MSQLFIIIGSFSAALSVILGAFGAHALKQKITPERLDTYQTGVQYHIYHSLGLVLVGLLAQTGTYHNLMGWSGWLFIFGIILFSGSLYLLSATDQKWLGMITPFGGLSFIVGWILLAVSYLIH